MTDISSVIQWVISLVSDNLYPGVFLAALVETVFPPIPSEAIFPLAGYIIQSKQISEVHLLGVGIVGGAGATVGNILIYGVAIKLGRTAITRYAKRIRISQKKLDRAQDWFEKYGDKSVLFGRLVPGVRSLVSIPAGLFAMSFTKFVLYTFLGSCAWSMSLTVLGYYFGATLELF